MILLSWNYREDKIIPPPPPHHRIAAERTKQALIAYYFTLVLYIVFSFLPEYRVWGFNWWAYYPLWLRLMLVLVGAAAPPLAIRYLGADSVSDEQVSHGSRRFWLIALSISIVLVALFVVLRARMHFLGDGYLLLGVLSEQHVMGRAWTAVGDQLHAAVFDLLSGNAEEKALGTFQMFSWLSGLATLTVFAFLARYLAQGTLRRTLVFLSLATGGYALLFFGYVENYPPFIFAVALFLLFALLIVKERITVYWIILPLVPAFLTHIFAVALIPPTVYLLLYRSPLARRYASVPVKTRRMLFLLTVIAGLAALIAMYVKVLFIRYALVPLVANEVTTDSYTFFSLAHLLDYVNLLFVLMPGLLVAMVRAHRHAIAIAARSI